MLGRLPRPAVRNLRRRVLNPPARNRKPNRSLAWTLRLWLRMSVRPFHRSIRPSAHLCIDRYGRSGEAECLLCSWSAAANAAALVTVAALALPAFALYVRRAVLRRAGPVPRLCHAGPLPCRPRAMLAPCRATRSMPAGVCAPCGCAVACEDCKPPGHAHTHAHARMHFDGFGAGKALGSHGGDSAAGRAEPPGQKRAFPHELPLAPHAVPDPVAQGTTLAGGCSRRMAAATIY